MRIRNRGFALAITLSITLATTLAAAGPAEDYKAALDAYRLGDVRNAVSILRKPADAGHAPSQVLLGEILDLADHNEEAVRYFQLAAAQGSADGCYGLAMMYASGEGVPRNLASAREWMSKAAQGGHTGAIQALALSYIDGGLAVEVGQGDSPEALHWIEAAAKLDSLPAIDRLAVAYRKGELGLAVDAQRAAALEARARELRKVTLPTKKSRKDAKSHG